MLNGEHIFNPNYYKGNMKMIKKCLVSLSLLAFLMPMASVILADSHKKLTIALIPGVVDPFYFTMHRGAKHAADALGVNLLFQVPKQWNVSVQVPILNAIIAKKPDAILIAPTDKIQLIAPLQAAVEQGILVITVDTFIDDGMYQDGSGRGDFPLSYIASDNVLGGRMAARALAKSLNNKGQVYVSNTIPGISTTDQREEARHNPFKNSIQ